MIVRGKNIGRTNNTITTKTKVFSDLLNNIEDSDLMMMDSIDLLTIINQGILPSNDAIKSILVTEPFSDERKASLEKIKDDIKSGKDLTISTSSEEEIPEDNEESIDTETSGDIKKSSKKLSKLNLIKNLKSIDNALVNAIDDSEAIGVLMANRLRRMWESVINGDISLEDIVSECDGSGKFYKILANQFKEEYDAVNSYVAPHGFSAHKICTDGSINYIKPNMMQKLCVTRLKKNRCYGNWSGMGSGKTLSSIISSREVLSHLTVVVVLNSNVNQWAEDILNAYPETTGTMVYCIRDGNYESINFDMTKFNYVIIPYSRFSQPNEEQKLKNIADKGVGFMIIDEVHKAKRRGEDGDESKRRTRLLKFISWARQTNSEFYEMVMSGTPIINELSEAKSLLTLLTGNSFDDIKTNRTLSNALKLHQMLLIHGLRFVPKYDQELNILTSDNTANLKINGNKYLDKIKECKSIDAEKLFVKDKLEAIKSYLGKGVLIYTHYTTDFLTPIRSFVESCGFTTSLYSDNRDNRDQELLRFRKGEADIMVASDPINTGVDRLQEVCNTMIIITLPWTNADFEQLKGRIYRQGMRSSCVNIIIPQVVIEDGKDNSWSWDKQRYDLIKLKKTLADCVIDGVIPSITFPTRETLYKKSIESLKVWKDRVNSGDLLLREDSGVSINLEVEADERSKKIQSLISTFNNRGKRADHNKFHKEITENPSDWFEYHKARHESMKTWDEIPYEYIAKKIKNKNRIVADFGCGENLMKTLISNKVYSFDHVAIDDSVIACDMAHTPLDDETIDIAVFSLAL